MTHHSGRFRFGLCCLFSEQPIKFRQATAKSLAALKRNLQLELVSNICLANLQNLLSGLAWIVPNDIKAFRVLSPLFPRYTHPDVGYTITDLPDTDRLYDLCAQIKAYIEQHEIRLSLHPDQFNVLSSPHRNVIEKTIEELEYQGLLAELIGAEVINIHGGGAYGDKSTALARLKTNFLRLSRRVRLRLTLENDDITYSPADLLPVCKELGIPLVYDVHHHRCLIDELSIESATERCVDSWDIRRQEPYFHLSSPRDGWQARNPRPHADYIDPDDFPEEWRDLKATIDIEAKAKELAVLQLMDDLSRTGSQPYHPPQ